MRLFMPIVCLFIVLLVNVIRTPDFFNITLKDGQLSGWLIDVINRGSELVILGNYTRPASFTYEEFEMTKEVRNFSNMRNYWYPLPQHDVDALRNLKQNPGW